MNRNFNIQLLRILSAFIVFAGHYLGMMPNRIFGGLSHTPLHLFFDGQSAVFVFMAISGFFYYRCEKSQSLGEFVSYYLRHLKKKTTKITPPHILLLIIAFCLCNYLDVSYNQSLFTDWTNSFWQERCSLKELINQCLIILPRDADVLNPPSWYLTVEVRMFIVMPVIVAMLNKTSWKLMVLLFIPIVMRLPIVDTLMFYLMPALAHKHIGRIENKVRSNWSKLFVLIIGIALINIRNEIHLDEDKLLAFEFVISFIQAVGATMIVVIFYLLPLSTGLTDRMRGMIINLSDYTYEFYLTHFIVLLALRPVVSDIFQLLILSLAISAITTLFVKKICGVMRVKPINGM